ncbi:hypothetical protein [Falsiroseomonas oryzae]|uniref:hypothetical protein n=1 Tax=Falsiroseomonas oryzae TaxID=2766473 RepID=UPI0022EA2BE1|nr:hypothetical protein [Roseomonas sp. MO-31]
MPFDNASLVPLVANGGFTIWLYRTTDTRAAALAPGYFAGAAARLVSGDVMFLQAADALTLTTVRLGTDMAPGLVVDTFAVPFRVNRTSAQRFSVRQVASAVAMSVLLAPLAGNPIAGGTVQAEAAVAGPVAQVAFSISDAGGTTVRGPQTAAVSGGSASATLPAPAAGTGYRLRVEAVGFPQVADLSAPFAVSAPYVLLTQAGDVLVTQAGDRLLI